jgi:hypothetical protein
LNQTPSINALYEQVTDRIIRELEQGNIPWIKPWVMGTPASNLISKKPYQGINSITMTFEIELEQHHLTKPVKTQTGNPEADYYLDIIYRLELKAYETLKSRERNGSGKIGNTKGNRWKQSSAEFFKSLASVLNFLSVPIENIRNLDKK